MKVTKAEFIISAVGPNQYPEDALPEIALAGRSNVGKSSLINRMINRKNLARTSSTPGKTQHLNYYRVNDQLYFVDVPGYGYAKVSKSQREVWGKMIEKYLQEREMLKLVLQIIDLRHPPTKDDELMYDWLKAYELPVCVVATKADKVPKSRWQKHLKIIKEALVLRAGDPLILFSSEEGIGKDELWAQIERYAGLTEGTEATGLEASDTENGKS
ncbi:ribosome biogenesis GTP-binding protein YihA/YsxC [Paenibacillus barengoltzii]|uniref:Probable GTP-binding protein EngB n=1 Tax=Paenibacillus barengoltzii G22 TaxID=1235795 RepID=R9LS78_9BACL|nr:ribosome biogenesis GTP-binding protein YihA/YsxC [Paenibacillus barengoltzii]EOS58582.1 ribosome biogenesis GTP-binding protein YsxC [Paenibacillus barengoltzii G22]MEC2343313.1 ribosome biogenesis GTP-binding protein YihA/YsxC [Paenibacillus barengoltzii]